MCFGLLELFSGKVIHLELIGKIFNENAVRYKFSEKLEGETDVEYGQRFIREFMLAALAVKELSDNNKAKKEAVKDLVPDPVPEDSIG